MFAYADQNFIIPCSANPEWSSALKKAIARGTWTFVLSPFHFYEVGNVDREDYREEILTFLEEINPAWLLDRVDLQVRELQREWFGIWDRTVVVPPLRAIGTLADAASGLFRLPVSRFAGLTIRRFVAEFTRERLDALLIPAMKDQCRKAHDNRESFRAGKLTKQTISSIEKAYVAQTLALRGRHTEAEALRRAVDRLRSDSVLAEQIRWFVDCRLLDGLKTYAVESAFTQDFYEGDATLDVNGFVDRQHGIVALAHCDVLVTNDKGFIGACERVRKKLPFPLARVVKPNDFITGITAGR